MDKVSLTQDSDAEPWMAIFIAVISGIWEI